MNYIVEPELVYPKMKIHKDSATSAAGTKAVFDYRGRQRVIFLNSSPKLAPNVLNTVYARKSGLTARNVSHTMLTMLV